MQGRCSITIPFTKRRFFMGATVSSDKTIRKFPIRLLLTLARNEELRKAQIAVDGISIGNINTLAKTMLPKSFSGGWSSGLHVAEKLGPLILKQYPTLANISLQGIHEGNYEEFVARATKKFRSRKLEILPTE